MAESDKRPTLKSLQNLEDIQRQGRAIWLHPKKERMREIFETTGFLVTGIFSDHIIATPADDSGRQYSFDLNTEVRGVEA